MSKRVKGSDALTSTEEPEISISDMILSSDIGDIIQETTSSNAQPYHTSLCGSLLYSTPTNSPSDIFSLLLHGNFDAFRRSFDVYYNDIIRMRNTYGQTVLHILTIHAYKYVWVRLLMMRGCDIRAQDNDGYTAAHYAIERDDVEMLKALTHRFHVQAKLIPEARIQQVHEQCLQALSFRTNQGLTAFMLACQCGAQKCFDYLIELKINDCGLQDKFGDTCVHYAVARRNQLLVEKLVNQCQADVNGGNSTRPSVLDVLQYNREQQQPFDREKDDLLEKFLLSHHAKNRCTIRRISIKRKANETDNEACVTNLAALSIDLSQHPETKTAQSHARLATTLRANGDLAGALENYKRAMSYVPLDSLDLATYAFQAAVVHMNLGENDTALDLLRKALDIRKPREQNSDEIDQIESAINIIQSSKC